MAQKLLIIATLCLSAALVPRAAHADGDTEARLRAALRGATTQVRALEDQQAVLQAKHAESDRQNAALRQQVDALTKQLEAAGGAPASKKAARERAPDSRILAEFNRKIAAQNAVIGQLSDVLEKWKGAYNEAVTAARTKEAERAQLATKVDGLANQATGCETKNAALLKIGGEILDRYKHVGFGDVLAVREPFIGTKRVELQNIAQDYQDKLLEQKVSQ